jgi:hypothetical protein
VRANCVKEGKRERRRNQPEPATPIFPSHSRADCAGAAAAAAAAAPAAAAAAASSSSSATAAAAASGDASAACETRCNGGHGGCASAGFCQSDDGVPSRSIGYSSLLASDSYSKLAAAQKLYNGVVVAGSSVNMFGVETVYVVSKLHRADPNSVFGKLLLSENASTITADLLQVAKDLPLVEGTPSVPNDSSVYFSHFAAGKVSDSPNSFG